MEINQSLYEILGVEQDADLDAIKRAYRKLVQVHHPDKAGNSPENTERFALICKAYEILSDPEKRALYDKPRRSRTFYRSSWRPPKGANFSSDQPHTESRFTHKTSTRNPSWKQPQNSLNLDDLYSVEQLRKHPIWKQSLSLEGDMHKIKPELENVVMVRIFMSWLMYHAVQLHEVGWYSLSIKDCVVQMVWKCNLYWNSFICVSQRTPVMERSWILRRWDIRVLNGGRSGDLHCTVNIVDDELYEEQQTSSSVNRNVSYPKYIL